MGDVVYTAETSELDWGFVMSRHGVDTSDRVVFVRVHR
jgi:hypothetical protein